MAEPQRPGLVLVTGASAGLGEAFARAYARQGRDLAIVARRADRLEALAAELSKAHRIEVLPIAADLSIWEAHKPVLAAIADHGRHVQTLVNNAGFGVPQEYVDAPWETQRDFLMTLVVSACGLAHGVIPSMVERGSGAIVNVASMAGLAPGAAGHSLYPAAKSFAIKFSQSLNAELRAKGIKVTAVCPGLVKTDFHIAAGTQDLMDQAPRSFWSTAEEVVDATLAANARGKVVLVPGWHNKVAAVAMRYLPDPLVEAMIARGAEKYRLKT